MWRTPATLRGSLDDVPNAAAAMILALETSCDDTCAAVVTARGRGPRERRLLPGRARPLRRRRAGDRLAPPPRARQRGRRRRARARRARRSTTSTLVAVTQGPGLVGALLVGVATAKGLAAARAAAAGPGRPPAGPRRGELPRAGADRAAVPVPDRLRRAHAARPRRATTAATRCSGRTLDDAAGEAFDKGARLLGLGYPGGPALSQLAPRATRRRSPSRPRRACAGLDFSFAGLEDRAALHGARPGGGGDRAAAPPTSPRRYEHAIVEALIARVERALAAEPGAAARDRRRRGREPAAARARRGARRRRSTCRRPSCAPTTPR